MRNKAGGKETAKQTEPKESTFRRQILEVKCHNPPNLVHRCPKLQK